MEAVGTTAELALRDLHKLCGDQGWRPSVQKLTRGGYLVTVRLANGNGVVGIAEDPSIEQAIARATSMARGRSLQRAAKIRRESARIMRRRQMAGLNPVRLAA